MNHATRFTNVCARQITDICAIIQHPIKAGLKAGVVIMEMIWLRLCSLMCALLVNHL